MRSINFLIYLMLLFFTDVLASDNICQIGALERYGNSHFSLGVYLENSDTLAGLQIPVSFDFGETVISCDSISFAGGRCQDFEFLDSKIDNERHIVYISGVSNISAEANNEPLLPGRGEIARIYFTYEGDPGNTQLKIRRARYEMGGNRLEYRFWKPNGTQVRCRFEAPPVRIAQ